MDRAGATRGGWRELAPDGLHWTGLDRIPVREQFETPAMTVRQVAAYLNVNEKTVYRLAQRRELPAFKVAGAWRFKREDIDLWIERQKETDAAGARRR